MKEWRDLRMLTLTLNHEHFGAPEKGFDHVGKKRAISELAKRFGFRFIEALEFHKDGWPHWHLLIDKWVDAGEVWKVWERLIGAKSRVDLLRITRGAKGGARYIAKYMSKGAKLPAWVKERRVRFFSNSRSVVSWSKWLHPSYAHKAVGSGRRRQKGLSLAQRLANCGSSCVILREERIRKGDKVHVRRQFLRRVPFKLRVVAEVAGQLGLGFNVRPLEDVICWITVNCDRVEYQPAWVVPVGVRSIGVSSTDGDRLLAFFDRVAA